MTGAAGEFVENVGIDGRWRSAEIAHVADEAGIAEHLLEIFAADTEPEDGTVAIHLGGDGGIDCGFDAQLTGQSADAGIVAEVLLHQDVGDDDFDTPRDLRRRMASIDFLSEPGSLVMAS